MVTGLTVPTLLPWPVVGGGAAAVERAGCPEDEDRAAGREDRGQQRDGEDRADPGRPVRAALEAATAAAGCRSVRRRLEPALGVGETGA